MAFRRVTVITMGNELTCRTLCLLETNLDDMSPELLPFVVSRLLDAGARDAWSTPIIMKHGRPAVVLSALVEPEERDRFIDLMIHETTTLGVRVQTVERFELPREEVFLDTEFGAVRAKRSQLPGGYGFRVKIESTELVRIAHEQQRSVLEIQQVLNSVVAKQ